MKPSGLAFAALSFAGCSLINDFSIGDGGTDAGMDAASSSIDSGRGAGLDAGAGPDAGISNACTGASDRAAVGRTNITVGPATDLAYYEASVECARVECDVLAPGARSGDVEAIAAYRTCIAACLRSATSGARASLTCETCFVELAFYALDECINPCSTDSERCVPDAGCPCESCLCSRDYFTTLSDCTGIANDLCASL